MKRILSLVLAVVMIMTVLCGCNQEYTAKVEKNGQTKINIFTSIPVEMVEAMGGAEGNEAELEDMEIKTIDGEECYVEEIKEKFKSPKKATEYVMENFGEEAGGLFKTFKVAKNKFEAKLIEGTMDAMVIYGDSMTVKVAITLPYAVTKTNGKLSKDKKTVTFDLAEVESEKLYAYTANAMYIKKAYLKTKSSAFLSWNKLDGAKKYKVSYKAIGSDDWKSFETKKTSATVKKLEEGKIYTFKVTAVLEKGTSASFESQVIVLRTTKAKVVAKTKKAVELEWNMNLNADGYIIYKKLSGTKEWTKVKTLNDCYYNWYTVKKLESGTKYDFKVVAFSKENGKKVEFSGAKVTAKTN